MCVLDGSCYFSNNFSNNSRYPQFINDLAGEDNPALINNGLYQADPYVDFFEVPSEDGQATLTFVECPGYNDPQKSDIYISRLVYNFLKDPL